MSSERNDPPRPEEPDPGLDVDAAFAEIVANWRPAEPASDAGPRSEQQQETQPESQPAADEPAPTDPPEAAPGDRDSLRSLFRPAFGDALDTPATWDDEGHFVPPPAPPLPVVDPRRRLAWYAMFGSPALALLFILLGVTMPGWVLVGMVGGFVGGFLYLVATMGSPSGDDWTGGDGAVL